MTVIAEIKSALRSIENDKALYDELNFDSRADAIDFIDFHIIFRIEGLEQNKELNLLKQRATDVKNKLEDIDTGMFKRLRQNISAGAYAETSFRDMVCKYLGYDVSSFNLPDEAGYDNLDIFINGLLSDEVVPEPVTAQGLEMVFYQKTPARIVFQMAELVKLNRNDVFFDIGSGLGQVSILVNLISGAKAIGVEYEPAYCKYAEICARQLNLPDVEFINADARKVDYSSGTVFFMYTPFEGSMMKEMLEVLRKESQKKPIRIFTYGPCSSTVAKEAWINCLNGDGDGIYRLYQFNSKN